MQAIGSSRLYPGAKIDSFEIEAVSRERLTIPAVSGFTHLQFRRFAGCPVCSLHLRSFSHYYDELNLRGIREVIFFHASREALQKYHGDLPFPVVADDDLRFYRRFGVERRAQALLHPKAWPAIVRGLFATLRAPLPEHAKTAIGLPADFLVDSRGRVLASKYGQHADDQWSVNEVLGLSSRVSTPSNYHKHENTHR